MKPHSQVNGFTLIELMISLTVMAVLLTIALPSYSKHMQKSRRLELQQELIHYQLLFERCYSMTVDFLECKNSMFTEIKQYPSHRRSLYLIEANASQTDYTLIASATLFGTQQGDSSRNISCEVLSIDHQGHLYPEACW